MNDMNATSELRMEEGGQGLWRWLFILLAAGACALLAATLETGRLYAQGAGFSFSGALLRVITPNGDGINDVAIVCYENPRDSAVSGKILDLRGQEVSPMVRVEDNNYSASQTAVHWCADKYPPSLLPKIPEAMTWDGKSGGATVASGVYIYQLQSEDTTVTGTVLVVR